MIPKLIFLCFLQAAMTQPLPPPVKGPPKKPPDAAERLMNGPGRKYHMHDMFRPIFLPNNTVEFRVGKNLQTLNKMLRACKIDLAFIDKPCLLTSKLERCMEYSSDDFEENFILLNMIMLIEEQHKCSSYGAWKFLEDYPMINRKLPDDYRMLHVCEKLRTMRRLWNDLPFGLQQMSDIMTTIIDWLDSVNTCLDYDTAIANEILTKCVQGRDESFRHDYLCIRIHFTLGCVDEIPKDNRAVSNIVNDLKRKSNAYSCETFLWDFYRFINKKSKNATVSFYNELETNGTRWILSGNEKHDERKPRDGHFKEETEEVTPWSSQTQFQLSDLWDNYGDDDEKKDEEDSLDLYDFIDENEEGETNNGTDAQTKEDEINNNDVDMDVLLGNTKNGGSAEDIEGSENETGEEQDGGKSDASSDDAGQSDETNESKTGKEAEGGQSKTTSSDDTTKEGRSKTTSSDDTTKEGRSKTTSNDDTPQEGRSNTKSRVVTKTTSSDDTPKEGSSKTKTGVVTETTPSDDTTKEGSSKTKSRVVTVKSPLPK